jgi:VanZ family protein
MFSALRFTIFKRYVSRFPAKVPQSSAVHDFSAKVAKVTVYDFPQKKFNALLQKLQKVQGYGF